MQNQGDISSKPAIKAETRKLGECDSIVLLPVDIWLLIINFLDRNSAFKFILCLLADSATEYFKLYTEVAEGNVLLR